MAESDDEIYKKAYADEQGRIRVEAIKAKAEKDARLAASGLSARHKKTSLGRWVQKKKLLISGGQIELQDLTRQDLQSRINEVTKAFVDKRKQLALKQIKLRAAAEDQRKMDQREGRPHISLNRRGYQPPEHWEMLRLESLLNDLKKELELRIRLNTY